MNAKGKRVRLISIFSAILLLALVLFSAASPTTVDDMNIMMPILYGALVPKGPPAKMADFWVGHAKWVFERAFPLNGDSGQIIVGPYDSASGSHPWYHFEGGCLPGVTTCTCGWGILVSKSVDKGRSWSPLTSVVTPTPGTPYACYATDGRAFYDAPLNTWHYLFQCTDKTLVWNGCHIQMPGPDPTVGGTYGTAGSLWSAPGGLLSISSGELWTKICTPGKKCYTANGTAQEGTFDIFKKDSSGYFWVDFHGAEKTSPNPVTNMQMTRGIGKTLDFHTWVVAGSGGTPNDSIFDVPTMQTPLNTNINETWPASVAAGGAGDIYEENGFYYLIEEASNTETFTQALHWDMVMARTNNLSTAYWDYQTLAMGNPILLSSAPASSAATVPPRTIDYYPQFFLDPDTGFTYLTIDNDDSGNANLASAYLYKLTLTNNRLVNADFTTGTFSNWSTLGSGVFADVLKQPWNAFNREKTVLSMGCGASCASGASIYQDVTGVSDLAGVNMTASVALASNISGVVQLQVFQFTSSGALIGSSIGSSSLALRGSGQWQTFKKYFKAAPNVEKMRFQIYLETPNAQILLNEPNLGASDGSHPEPYVAR